MTSIFPVPVFTSTSFFEGIAYFAAKRGSS